MRVAREEDYAEAGGKRNHRQDELQLASPQREHVAREPAATADVAVAAVPVVAVAAADFAVINLAAAARSSLMISDFAVAVD